MSETATVALTPPGKLLNPAVLEPSVYGANRWYGAHLALTPETEAVLEMMVADVVLGMWRLRPAGLCSPIRRVMMDRGIAGPAFFARSLTRPRLCDLEQEAVSDVMLSGSTVRLEVRMSAFITQRNGRRGRGVDAELLAVHFLTPTEGANDMAKTVFVYGPGGSGKSYHREALAKHYGCTSVTEDWRPGDEVREGTLVLTHLDVPGGIHIADALQAAGIPART